jgi:DNA-binding Lrp family transcriptional regulator
LIEGNLMNASKAILLKYLREDSRMNLSEISRKTKIPVPTLMRALSSLEKGIITRYCSILDLSRLGYNLRVHFIIKIKKTDDVKEFLMASPYVNSCYILMKDYDFYVECFFRSLKEMSEFKDLIHAFQPAALEETFIIEDLKREMFSDYNDEKEEYV